MNRWINNKLAFVLFICLLGSLGANIFLFIKTGSYKRQQLNTTNNLLLGENEFVDDDADYILHFQPLKQYINLYLEDINNKQNKIAIYLQSLKSGAWLGVNETEEFTPASLLKVPIAMAVLKNVEEGRLNLDDVSEVIISDIENEKQKDSPLTIGIKLTIRDQLQWMLTHSNNTAKNMLWRQLKTEDLARVFVHIGVPDPYLQFSSKKISTRGYTRIFKSLYFSTYLTREHSALILSDLTDARAENLLAFGVPWEIQVAHKYGESEGSIHDCGIVYLPHNPYVLCLMTQNIEPSQAISVIQDISSLVYKFASQE